MPEIKNQFTGGKMNKDLDERLVPNGEYRDAMNIQVSTSEESDVGTVQNILGNTLVQNQNFIGDDAFCVGSVSDEKNDKLYYLIDNKKQILPDMYFDDESNFVSDSSFSNNFTGDGVVINSNIVPGATPTTYPGFRTNTFNLEDGKRYKVEVDIKDFKNNDSQGDIKIFLAGINTGNSGYRPLNDSSSSNYILNNTDKYVNIFTFNQASNNNSTEMRLQFELVNGTVYRKSLSINSISISELNPMDSEVLGNDLLVNFIDSDWDIYGGFGTSWTISNNVFQAGAQPDYGYARVTVPEIIQGNEYEIKYTITTGGSGQFILANHGSGSTPSQTNIHLEESVGTYTKRWVQGSGNVGKIVLYNDGAFNGVVEDISVRQVLSVPSQVNSCIVEYDNKSKTITPVLIDSTDEVLNFSRQRLITGINIVDDMLFFTDNYTEPKKINIPRSIKGTSSDFTHTQFINEHNEIETDIKEEHITVIKKQPVLAPLIKLNTQRDSSNAYTALTRVGTSDSTDNDAIVGGDYDFVNLSLNDIFYLRLFTDINDNDDFQLAWNVGDELVIKAFEGQNYDQQPSVPLTNFNFKVKILEDHLNSFTGSSSGYTLNNNPDFTNSTMGSWTSHHGPNYFVYNAAQDRIDVDTTYGSGQNWAKFTSSTINFVYGATYEMTLDIERDSGKYSVQVHTGAANLNITNHNHNVRLYNTGDRTTSGVQTFTFKFEPGQLNYTIPMLNANNPYNPSSSYNNKIMLQGASISNGGFVGRVNSFSIRRIDNLDPYVKVKVISIGTPPQGVPPGLSQLNYVVDRYDENLSIFEFKLPRIAYRYRYQDNEYSAISPYSQVAFVPGNFDYHPKKGYNLGMSNRITSIEVSDFKKNIPDGVKEIDIIYKEDTSTNLYVVDTITPNAILNNNNAWDEDTYTIKNEQIYKAINANQLIRPWDNVPKVALAQEVVGSRIVYANYKQGFDLKYNNEDYYPDFNFSILSESIGEKPLPSIKSLRDYQIGAVFVDEYGRETPVISNFTATNKLSKSFSDKQNKISISFNNNNFPDDLKYFKFFIKETSGEYYNMAMDRFYNAQDNQIWLSFPSSDVNKVNIDDFLILKKGIEKETLVTEEARYKVLDIQNEAPDFIKQKKLLIESLTHNTSSTPAVNIFSQSINDNTFPLEGKNTFKMDYEEFTNSVSTSFDDQDGVLYIEFSNTATNVVSERYRINKIKSDFGQSGINLQTAQYTVFLEKVLGPDVNFIVDDINNVSSIQDNITVNIYRYEVENSAKFDGKFFIKINADGVIGSNILTSELSSNLKANYRPLFSKRLYSMNSDHKVTHKALLTGQSLGQYNEDFGRFAPYFRNYIHAPNERQMNEMGAGAGGGAASVDVGQYAFASGSQVADINKYYRQTFLTADWKNEIAFITVGRDTNTANTEYTGGGWSGYNNNLNPGSRWSTASFQNEARRADSHGWMKSERENNTVWFIDKGPKVATRYLTGSNSLDLGNSGNNTPSTGIGFAETTGLLQIDMAVGGVLRNANYKPNGELEKVLHIHGSSQIQENYWNVGADGGNNNYDTESTISFVNTLSGGNKFRFKEDPTNEVYSVIGSNKYGSIRYKSESSNNWLWEDVLEHPTNNNTYDEDGDTWTGLGGSSHEINPNTEKRVAQLSTNFTTNYKLTVLNSQNLPVVSWNPAGPIGPIPEGLVLTKAHSAYSGSQSTTPKATYSTSGSQCYVCVDNLNATDADGNTVVIKKGLILYSHSNAAAGHIFDGTAGFEELLIWKITEHGAHFRLHLCGYRTILNLNATSLEITVHDIKTNLPTTAQNMVFKQPTMNGYSQYSCNRLNTQDPLNHGYGLFDEDMGIVGGTPGIMPVFYNLEIVEEIEREAVMPSNPAIWETEPKENTPLDVYYEASGYNPLFFTQENKYIAIPLGSSVSSATPGISITKTTVDSVGYNGTANTLGLNGDGTVGTPGWYINFAWGGSTFLLPGQTGGSGQGHAVKVSDIIPGPGDEKKGLNIGDAIKIHKPDGSSITVTIQGWEGAYGDAINGFYTNRIYVLENLSTLKTSYTLNWYNCFSFGNGVESNRVRDSFNLPFMANGVKASTTLEFSNYKEEHRKYGLIYSGLYNANSGVNNLNQFIAGEKITKDINPTYGSIQKLHARNTDLITLCEDKVLQILASKDAVFEADGNPQLVATNRVLGQSRPFVGEYGISKNPESFASESYRTYFTDKVRGAVIRLSKDGLTPISDAGMKDWFRDNLKLSRKLIGSYDDKKDQYNLTVNSAENPVTVSFKESVRGWVSFKSFVPENGLSCANDYFTVKKGKLYQHHVDSFYVQGQEYNVSRNTFYGEYTNSSIDVVLNEAPSSIKSFHALTYEGSQSKIDIFATDTATGISDEQYYNAIAKDGWYVSGITTDQAQGSLNEFIEKEKKWFNYIKGVDSIVDKTTDFSALEIQGLGVVESVNGNFIDFSGEINVSMQKGDTIYFNSNNNITQVGKVVFISGDTIEVETGGTMPQASDYCFFVKNKIVNMSNLLGYYANAKFENNSKEKVEMFTVSAEITESSK